MPKNFTDPPHAEQPHWITKFDWKRFSDECRPLLGRARGVPESKRPEVQQKLARGGERLDRVTEGDRRFFVRHKHRNHRLRRAGQIEIEQKMIIAGRGLEQPRGMAWFTLVKQLPPGMRVRMVITLPETAGPDFSEPECERIFSRICAEI
jgi:hypothetical protein